MTPEIKQRIEQIKNGEIPEGFKKTKTGVIPTSWKYEKLDSYLIQHHEVSTQNNQYPVLTSSRKGIFFQKQYYDKEVASEDNTGYNVVPRGYFTYRHMSDDEVFVFNINTICDKGIVSTLYPVFSVTNSINPYFLQKMLNNGSDFHRYARIQKQGGSRTYMYFNKLTKLSIPIPSLDEQNRIMEILSSQDKVIECYEKKIDQLKRMKKYYLQNMFPKRGETVPKIRFKGFTDPWEQRKLGDCFKFLQNNTLSRAELSTETGAALNVHYGDVLIKFGEYLDISSEQIAYISNQGIVEKFKESHLADGDIIMADTAEDETVGKCSEIARLQGKTAIAGLHTIPLRPVEKFAPGFLGYYMNSGAYHYQLMPLMQGIKVTSVSKNAIKNTEISYPVDTTEQAAIGQYFMRIDTLITLHQRKLEEEKKKKKALQQLLLTGIVRTN